MKWVVHKPNNFDITKKQQADIQDNNSQNNRQHNMANQATFVECLA